MSFGFGFGLPHIRASLGGVGGYFSVSNQTVGLPSDYFVFGNNPPIVNADKTVDLHLLFEDYPNWFFAPSIMKLSTTGAFVSATGAATDANFSTGNYDGASYMYGYAQDSSGNTYALAWYNSAGNGIYKILKFNSSGAFTSGLSLDSLNSKVWTGGISLSIDASNNLIVGGGALATSGTMLPLVTITASTLTPTTWQYTSTYTMTPGTDSAGIALARNIQSAAGVVMGFAKYNGIASTTTSYVHSKTNAWARSIVAADTATYMYTDMYCCNADSAGNVYTLTRAGDGSGSFYLTLMKFNSSGALQWQNKIPTASPFACQTAICFDASNNVYVVFGDYDGYADYICFMKFEPSAGTQTFSRQWYEYYENFGTTVRGVTISSNDPNFIYITGCWYNVSTSDERAYVLKLPIDGSGMGNITWSGLTYVYALGVAVTAGDNVVATVTNPTYTTSTGTSSAYAPTFSSNTYNTVVAVV